MDSEESLLSRGRELAGRTVEEVARQRGVEVPDDLTHHKGWLGNFVESWFGVEANSRPEPDIANLGIEIKSFPVDAQGDPKETVYVSKLEVQEASTVTWAESNVAKKLRHVLWVPVETGVPLANRRFSQAFLWKPTLKEERLLQEDWEAAMATVAAGYLESLTADLGTWLQVRPKGQNSASTGLAPDGEGGLRMSVPRGFYLRRTFLQHLVKQEFGLPVSSSENAIGEV